MRAPDECVFALTKAWRRGAGRHYALHGAEAEELRGGTGCVRLWLLLWESLRSSRDADPGLDPALDPGLVQAR
jgi:hypothetical protein